jgi:hypothetical protein
VHDERLFSHVGIFFSDKRKSSKAETLENLVFAKLNCDGRCVPSPPP